MGEHCVDRIEHTLSHLDGVSHVNVDQTNKQVSVEYDPNMVKSGYIEETLQTLGYSIRE
jgi:copper chaperone CopZ